MSRNSPSAMAKLRTAVLSTSSQSAFTSFKSFSLYDSNIFTTFFYSNIERVWLMVVKNGCVYVDGFPVRTSVILHDMSRIEFDSVSIKFVSLRSEIGLSQILIERFLISNNCKIPEEQILALVSSYHDKGLVLECLRRNCLFYRDEAGWGLDYKNYIDFLEYRSDPLLDAVLCELQNSLTGSGLTKTFSINSIWTSPHFSDERPCMRRDASPCNSTGMSSNGAVGWPYSSRPFHHEDCDSSLTTEDSADAKSMIGRLIQEFHHGREEPEVRHAGVRASVRGKYASEPKGKAAFELYKDHPDYGAGADRGPAVHKKDYRVEDGAESSRKDAGCCRTDRDAANAKSLQAPGYVAGRSVKAESKAAVVISHSDPESEDLATRKYVHSTIKNADINKVSARKVASARSSPEDLGARQCICCERGAGNGYKMRIVADTGGREGPKADGRRRPELAEEYESAEEQENMRYAQVEPGRGEKKAFVGRRLREHMKRDAPNVRQEDAYHKSDSAGQLHCRLCSRKKNNDIETLMKKRADHAGTGQNNETAERNSTDGHSMPSLSEIATGSSAESILPSSSSTPNDKSKAPLLSKDFFVETYVADYSRGFDRAHKDTKPRNTFAFVYNRKPAGPVHQKRKSMPPFAKRTKLCIVADADPAVHALVDFEMKSASPISYFSDCEYCGLDSCSQGSQQRSLSSMEGGVCVDSNLEYDHWAFCTKRKIDRKRKKKAALCKDE